MEQKKNFEITSERLIVCEGVSDASLIKYLCADRGIEGYQIEQVGGEGQFAGFLRDLSVVRGFHNLRGIIVVGDCDDTPQKKFDSIRAQVDRANFPVSGLPYKIATRSNHTAPGTYILMVPFQLDPLEMRKGAIETMLLPPLESLNTGYTACVDQLCNCQNTAVLGKTIHDKVRLRSLLCCVHPSDPNLSIQWVVHPNYNIVPLSHPSLNGLANILSQLREEFTV